MRKVIVMMGAIQFSRKLGLFAAVIAALLADAGESAAERRVVKLDGTWEIAEGKMDALPQAFAHRVPVPGLADMATPPFADVGIKSERREAFWYRRTFRVDGAIPAVARLKIHKAKFGTRVFLNGQQLDDHLPCFTPGYFDVRKHLKGGGAENELIVRVGAFRDALPESRPTGWDFEKQRYLPGIYDSVELILTGGPFISNVQTAPDVAAKVVHGTVQVESGGAVGALKLSRKVREAESRRVVGSWETVSRRSMKEEDVQVQGFAISIEDCRLWSPEEPFLYELEASTGADTVRVRFGMRSFRFDKESGRAVLNGKPYLMRGTNVCIYRFFENPARGDRPWREEWVRRLHRKFKSMHWNSIRYCIGFPPELWYRIADEEGLLIQDEFPLWHLGKWPKELNSETLKFRGRYT